FCPQITQMHADTGPFSCRSASICVNPRATPDSVAAVGAGPICGHFPKAATKHADQGQSRLIKVNQGLAHEGVEPRLRTSSPLPSPPQVCGGEGEEEGKLLHE